MALLLLVWAGPSLTAFGQDTTPTREQELARIRTQIQQLKTEVVTAQKRESGAEGRLDLIEAELRLQLEQVAEARAAQALAVERVGKAETAVGELEVRLEKVRRDLRGRLASLYRLGGHGYARLFLSLRPGDSASGADGMLESVRMLRYLVRRDSRSFEQYQRVHDELEEQRETLVAQQESVDEWLIEEESRRQELATMRSRQESLLAELGGQRRNLQARTSELEDRESKLATFLDSLYGRSGRDLTGRPIQDFRGILDQPVSGSVTERFGPRRDPRYQTQVPHNGVSFATRSGDEVQAVYPGTVLFAAPFRGYGPTVIVHHAGRVFTLYAGLSSVQVGRDDVLSLGDVVGRSSDSLYFEIRVENRPEDPLQWFRSNR